MSGYDRIAEALLSHPFRFAKTMPEVPHWYTLRKEWDRYDHPTFDDVVRFIRDVGDRRRWGPYNNHYLDVNGMAYWSMGAPIDETILINKGATGWGQTADPYDEIAKGYDEMFSSAEDFAEERELVEMMGDLEGDVLDIGCGTGMLLNHISPTSYVGLDPSDAMLRRARDAHPGKGVAFIQAPLERFWMPARFDYVVSMYGSLNYVLDPEAAARATQFVAPGGKFMFVLYREGYKPKSHALATRPIPCVFHDPGIFGGDITEFKDYYIVKGTA